MLYAQFKMRDVLFRLRKIMNAIKDKDTEDKIDRYKPKFYGLIYDLKLSLEELNFLYPQSFYEVLKKQALEAIDTVKDQNINGEEFRRVINGIISSVPEAYDFNLPSLRDLSYNKRKDITSFYEISENNLELIANEIDANNKHNVNIIQPECYKGNELMVMKKNIPNTILYGIESDLNGFATAKKQLNRVAKGSLKGSRISNNAFDILLLKPSITWNLTNITLHSKRQEKEIIFETSKYLKKDGVCILFIPFFRLQQDICTFLAKNFKNIQIRRTTNDMFFKYSLVSIICQKKDNKEFDADEYNKLRTLKAEKIKDLNNPIDKVKLPASNTIVEMFRGSVLDFDEMNDLIEKTKCYEDFWNKQNDDSKMQDTKRPLLPFNIGQIGLVLTSGCLDGIVEEKDGACHLIKGRVSKKSEVEHSTDNNRLEIRETISNKVEIKVILPDGTFKTLA